MAEVTIPKEKMDYTIDLLITMVTDEIAEETGKDRKEILTDFLCSKTGKALYDEKTKLWCNGPAYIMLSVKLDAPVPCRLDAPDLDLICYASADCLRQHLQVI